MIEDMRNQSAGFLKGRLFEGEEVVEVGRIHWGIYWKSVAVLIFALLLWVNVAQELGMILLVAALLMAVYAALCQIIIRVVLTNKRFMVRAGLLQIEAVDVHFDKIESVELEQMIPGLIMRYHTLVMSGTGQRIIVVPYLANGPAIRRAYNEQVLGEKS